MICPNQLLVCDAYNRFGSAGDPLRWYIPHPPKCGPLMSQCFRLPSDVKMKAPFFVPISNRTLLIVFSSSAWCRYSPEPFISTASVVPASSPHSGSVEPVLPVCPRLSGGVGPLAGRFFDRTDLENSHANTRMLRHQLACVIQIIGLEQKKPAYLFLSLGVRPVRDGHLPVLEP